MNRYAIAIAVAAIVIAAFAMVPRQAADANEVRVGAVLALTGNFAVFGNAMREGIEIARDELNRHGNMTYRVIFEDDNLDITRAVEAGHRLISVDNVHASLVTAANEGKSLSYVFENERTPLIVLFDSNNDLSRGEYLFAMGFYNEGAAEMMACHAYSLGARNVSVIYSFDDWSNLMALTFRDEFESLGGSIIAFDGTEFSQTDFRTQITRAMQADAIYAPLVLPSNMIRQARELGFRGHVLSADGLNQDQIDAAGNAADGVIYTNLFLEENRRLAGLRQSFRERFGREPEIIELLATAAADRVLLRVELRYPCHGRRCRCKSCK